MNLHHEPTVVELKRPYGSQTILAVNTPATVKVISIDPHSHIGRHSHSNRDELWTVMDGYLSVQVDDRQWEAHAGERIWVPRGAVHRVANTREEVGRLLEVAFGVFSDEDIVRLEPSSGVVATSLEDG